MPQPDPNVPQVHSGGTDPSFAGAIVALLKALGTTLGPKPVVAPGTVLNAQEAAANGPGAPVRPVGPIGNPQPPGGLGNQSPGLGNSF